MSLRGIGRAWTIWGAQRPKTVLATAAPLSTRPKTPMSMQAGGNQPETSEQSPPPATGQAAAGLVSNADTPRENALGCPLLGSTHTLARAASGNERGMSLWESGL